MVDLVCMSPYPTMTPQYGGTCTIPRTALFSIHRVSRGGNSQTNPRKKAKNSRALAPIIISHWHTRTPHPIYFLSRGVFDLILLACHNLTLLALLSCSGTCVTNEPFLIAVSMFSNTSNSIFLCSQSVLSSPWFPIQKNAHLGFLCGRPDMGQQHYVRVI
jgi:hypothetical protein